jgi:hypothetical protein
MEEVLKALSDPLVLRGQMDKTAKMELLVRKVLLGLQALPEFKALREPMVLRVHKALQAQEVALIAGIQMVMAFKTPMKM